MPAATARPDAPTPHSELDAVVQRLKERSRVFARLSIRQRIALAGKLRQGYRDIAEESVRAACDAKGIAFDSPTSGEEWLAGPMVTIRNLRLLLESLEQIAEHGVPRIPASHVRHLPDGRIAVRVFPTSAMDAMLLAKHDGEAWMQPGVTADNLHEHQASFYKKPHDGRVCVILGAGNVNAIPPTDALYKLFVEGTVCVLKMNPVNAYLGPLLERAFRSAIEEGFFAVVYGGADVGRALVEHPAVDEVHITGSDKTHDLMVWGPPGPEREERISRNTPLLTKEITSELGNITPVIVLPGPWTESELQFQADNIAGMVTNNASFNCNAAKLLTVPKGWSQGPALLAAIERGIQKGQVRRAYYPGAEERFRQFTENRPGLRLLGNPKPGELPYAIIPDIDPARVDDVAFCQEPWCSVLSETRLEGADVPTFLKNAVNFVNEKVWGTLAVTLIVHPKTAAAHGPELERAIAELRYGSVVINTWAGAVFGLGSTPWGGHPSTTLANIQSGRGWVHNTLMLENVEKCVLRAPHRGVPISPWFPGHRTVHDLARRLIDFEMSPSWLKIPGIAATALRA